MTQYFHMNTRYQLITTVLSCLILYSHLCHLALGNSNTSIVKCFDEERKALLQFKDGITQDFCGLLDSWRDDSDCCQWHGVYCSNYTGHVTMLRFPDTVRFGTCIFGTLSPSLSLLKHLRHLDLSFNSLTPPISSFLGSLTNLEYLNLGYAFENAQINMNISWLPRLRLLRYLDLSGTGLSDTENWIQIISKLPLLGVLRLDDCHVNIPSSLAHINSSSNLRVISLSNNNFNQSSIFQWLFNLPRITTQLVYLDLSWISLEGLIPNDFGNLHHLSHLDLSNNYLEGHIPIVFETMDSLSYLSLSNNYFTDEITNVIQTLSSSENAPLSTLDLTQNHFWGAIPDSISSLNMLRELYLGGNQISQIRKGIGQLTMLEKLDISSNSLEDTLTHKHFLNLSRLRELYLSDNPRLVIDIDASWVPPFQLDIISLRSCKLGPSFPNWLYMQANFSYLDVSNAEMSNKIHISFWNSLPFKLQYLNML